MEVEQPGRETPLAEVQELEELKRRYRWFDSETLEKWSRAVTGSHCAAMEEILRERGAR